VDYSEIAQAEQMQTDNRSPKIPILFAATIFLGSGLLFLVQPMIAKAILPLAGGTPAVWNTCVFFFQGALLLGYAYGYLVTMRLKHRQQTLAHPILLVTGVAASALLFASIAAPTPGQANYAWWVLKYLTLTVGWLVLLLSANGIILQRWFATTTNDPYYLYSASNAGSFVALLAYPFLLEPYLNLIEQKRIWAVLFVVFVVAVFACAVATRKNNAQTSGTGEISDFALTWNRKLRWLFLAFVPSSLMLGATTYITTDIAPTPLFWIIPLSLYLLAFTLAFARRQWISSFTLARFLPGAAILLTLIYAAKATEPAWLLVLVHLIFFALAALLCHQLLAEDRPSVEHLPEFYVWIAVGGLLGGLFSALLAPVIFNALTEYPLTIVLTCLVLPMNSDVFHDTREQGRAALFALGIGVTVAMLSWFASGLQIGMMERVALVFAVPLIFINHVMTANPLRLAFALGAVLLGSIFFTPDVAKTLVAERNYFGALTVTLDRHRNARSLYLGTTIHGTQNLTLGKQCEPLSYFHPSGPVGQIFEAYNTKPASPDVAVIGLGTGAMAAYAKKGQRWTMYEINPLVIKLARDTGHFTYLHLCANAPINIVEGDARHTLTNAANAQFGLILMDAFNSDAIPVHLLTQEALDLYLSKLAPGGMLAFQISNRHLDLHPLLANLAQTRGLICLGFDDRDENLSIGKEASTWVVMARSREDLGLLATKANWQVVSENARVKVWRDDYSNLLQVLRW
jgi:hypothetical protein